MYRLTHRPKIFVLGANGMLGSYVFQYLTSQGEDVVPVTREHGFDARTFKTSNLPGHLTDVADNPFYIVNCIGVIKQKSQDPQEMFAINGTFPVELAAFLDRFSYARMIHISSDCVFSGNTHDPYEEDSVRDAKDFYGQSKIIGEECSNFADCHVIRTSIVGEDKSPVSLLEWVRSQNNGKINGYINHWWNGVTCFQLARFISAQINDFASYPNLLNYYTPVALTKFSLIKKIVDCYGLKIDLTKTTADKAIDRRMYSKHTNHIHPHMPAADIATQLAHQKNFTNVSKPFQSQSAEAPDGVP